MRAEAEPVGFDRLVHAGEVIRDPRYPPSVPPTASSTPAAPANKEWAVIVRALLAGEQILDVRKGGIREAGRHFGVPANRFWLAPTVEHQRAELLKPAYSRWVDDSVAAAPPGRAIRIEGWADLVGVATVTTDEALDAVTGSLIWSTDYVASRLRWKARDPLWILALRVHRLVTPLEIPWRDDYGGCTSWVTLDGLPADPGALPSELALEDAAFDARLTGARNALAEVGVELATPPTDD